MMLEEGLRKFAQENFSHRYYPILHGESEKIQPLALAVKKSRPIWKRPHGKHEIIVLAEMAKYVENDEIVKVFRDSLESQVKEEMFQSKPTIDMGNSAKAYSMGVSGYLEGTIKISGDQGVLKLGRLSQKYIDDPDLRGILANTPLDHNKMKGFKSDELFLITSVISSEKFQLEGERKQETEAEFNSEVPPIAANSFIRYFIPAGKVHARFFSTFLPPEVASRNSAAPILFKCCHVDYLKDENRLEIRKGEYVGKTVCRDMFGGDPTEEDPDYDSTYVEIYSEDQTDLPDELNPEDIKKLDLILTKVLLPTKNREECKALVEKYLIWFETALKNDQTKFLIKQPITRADCEFLRIAAYLSCSVGANTLDLGALTKDDIHGYAFVFRILSGLSDEKWEEIEKDGANLMP